MLLLACRVGPSRYAFQAADVIEVLPVVTLHPIAGTPGVAGLFSYRGAPVPVLDLTELLTGRPAARLLSTRLVVVHYPSAEGPRPLGLIAERCTDVVRRPREDFVPADLSNPDAPFLGPVASDAGGLLQLIDVTTVVPTAIRARLFANRMPAS